MKKSGRPGLLMNFEEQVTSLCAQAVAVKDEGEAQRIIAELRATLHRRIEELRRGLLHSYPLPGNVPQGVETVERKEVVKAPLEEHGGALNHLRTWIKVALELTEERSSQRALQLSQELDRMLREQVGEKPA